MCLCNVRVHARQVPTNGTPKTAGSVPVRALLVKLLLQNNLGRVACDRDFASVSDWQSSGFSRFGILVPKRHL